MISSEFASLSGEERMINLYLTVSSIPTDQLNVCRVFPRKLGAYRVWLLARPAFPFQCSHLLMEAVISLGSFTISQSHLDFWPYYSSGADCPNPMFTDTECFINALSNK